MGTSVPLHGAASQHKQLFVSGGLPGILKLRFLFGLIWSTSLRTTEQRKKKTKTPETNQPNKTKSSKNNYSERKVSAASSLEHSHALILLLFINKQATHTKQLLFKLLFFR